ncbi:MAG: hypothetical protein OXG92_10425 [Chloroflexi bacterium]|nr:hypothetical protein [Chloroflexota bacterium]MCY3582962.1 hypothetical protein [Chloroflexota bacterium]MCY3716866.1 hypothetical protein [Chloroflexota bacterium]MDE2649257.1 hypothetical protein [Chloroflexota bacterium]MXV93676.1 hypothetical protein [Chloroflexota bacterium]
MLDSGFYAGAERIGAFLLSNLISAFLLMTVVGLPLGLLGLFAMMNEWAQGRQPEFFRVYLGALRNRWRAALLLSLVDLLAGLLIAVNLSIIPNMGQDYLTILSLTMTICAAVVLLMANLYAWPLLTLLRLPLRTTIRLSLLLVFSQPWRSLAFTIAALLPLLASLFLPIAFALLLTLSLSAYITARGVLWSLSAQFPRDELNGLLAEATA